MNQISCVKVILMMSIVTIISSTIEASAIPEPENNSRSRGRSLCACPRMYDPICASNGITYGNECTYLCAARTKTDLKIVKRDACDAEYGAWDEIPYQYKPY